MRAGKGELGVLGHDEHQGIAHKIFPAGRDDEPLLLGLVHGLLIRRSKDVHRGALGDLLEQGAGSGKIEDDLGAGMLLFKALADFRKGVGQTGGGGHRQLLGRQNRRRLDQSHAPKGQKPQCHNSRPFHNLSFLSDYLRLTLKILPEVTRITIQAPEVSSTKARARVSFPACTAL